MKPTTSVGDKVDEMYDEINGIGRLIAEGERGNITLASGVKIETIRWEMRAVPDGERAMTPTRKA